MENPYIVEGESLHFQKEKPYIFQRRILILLRENQHILNERLGQALRPAPQFCVLCIEGHAPKREKSKNNHRMTGGDWF